MDVYFIAWLVFAFIYSVLAAFTRIFYLGKSVLQLNNYEYKINEGYFFEDLIDKKTNLSIGITKVEKFSKQDSDFYSKKYSHWLSSHFNKAFEKQKKFKKDYEDNYGYPKDLGLHKAWES